MLSLCPLLSLSFVTEAGIGLGFMNGGELIEDISVGKVSCCKNSTSDGEGARVGMETGYWGQKVRADSGEPLSASIRYETRQLRPGEGMQLA